MRVPHEVLHRAALLVVLTAWATPALAYRTLRGDTANPNTPGTVSWAEAAWNVDGVDSNLPSESVRTSVAQALTTWREADCLLPSFSVVLSSRDGAANDVAFLDGASWRAHGYPEDAVGITDLVADVTDTELHFVEAHVRLDARRRWATTPVEGSLNLDVVLAHELGHALGLLHPCETEGAGPLRCGVETPSALMNPEYDATVRAELQDDDRAALCSLYGLRESPSPAAPAPPTGTVGDLCEEAGTCLASECVDGVCRVASCRGYECTGAAFGVACGVGEDCATGLCLQDDEPSYCTKRCGEATCPTGFVCDEVDGASVCVADHASSGCDAGSSSSTPMAWCVVLMVTILRSMRRRTENVR